MNVNNKFSKIYNNSIRVIKNNYIIIIILISSLILYNYFWDIIVASKIYSMKAAVYDLGVVYERLWVVFNKPDLKLVIGNIENSGIVILMSPLSLIHNLFFFVYLQTFWLSFTAIPLYFISYKEIKSKTLSLIIAVSYLLFFGITGINWFDVHFQSLFIPLFVTGYAMKLYDKKRLSLIFLILSGVTRFPYIIFPLFLGFTYIAENFYYRDFSIKSNKFYYYLFFISLFFMILGFIFINTTNFNGIVSMGGGNTNYLPNFKNNLDNKVFSFFLLLSPFLMLPLFSKRFSLMMVPYFFMVFFSGNNAYIFPDANISQYNTAIVPFLYLGFIIALKKFNLNKKINSNALKIRLGDRHKIVITMFIIIILLGVLYEPYGYLNNDTSANFNLNHIVNYNKTVYQEFDKIVSLIPNDNAYVLYQDNMPEVNLKDPSAQLRYQLTYSQNYTYFINNHWTKKIDYVIADPYSRFFNVELPYSGSMTFYKIVNHYISLKYGILAEYDGLILLEKNYTGNPKLYGAENYNYNLNGIASNFKENNLIFGRNITNNTLFTTNDIFLQPGKYILNLNIKTSNMSSKNNFLLNYTYMVNPYSGKKIMLKSFIVNGNNISMKNKWVNLTFNISAKNYYNYVQFSVQNFSWNGSFYMRSMYIKEVQE